MANTVMEYAFVVGILVQEVIRAPRRIRYLRASRSGQIVEQRTGTLDVILMRLGTCGELLAPLFYVANTDWFAFADYDLPAWMGWIGAIFLLLGTWLLLRAHADLGRNWSPTMEIAEGHGLVTGGIYGIIRHPIYAAMWLTVIAQALMIENWFVGFAGLAVYLPFYLTRVPAEERMMLDRFGDEYRTYAERVGGIIPKLGGRRN